MAEFRLRAFLLVMILMVITQITHQNSTTNSRRVVEINGGVDSDSVVWIVQLSDLHFSVHHPIRALDFVNVVGRALSFINPSLVFITGDLTDGKSKDMLTMKQDEREWVEYKNAIEDVVKKSGLDINIFYDVRGNHDNFGVPYVGSSYDFFSKYSVNGQLGRPGQVNSVTLQTGKRRHLFVGIDSTMTVGLRGPTNLFGHPTDELLTELDSELSQWDTDPTKPVTKISFGHFPLSFSATSESGKTLEDVFLKHSISAYLCGHLHTSFGKNLKRHHQPGNNPIQVNMGRTASSEYQEFWEWEMGDWRKSRAVRIVAIDRGQTSFLDISLKSGFENTFIVPTFPLDSRVMFRSSLKTEYDPSDYMTIRALIFSSSPIQSVIARVYDSQFGPFSSVLEESMTKKTGSGNLYAAPWNFKAFEDPNPERYWLQIETIDNNGKSTLTDLRPFSINGVPGKLSWTWKEFIVMGCQWSDLYLPILYISLGFFLLVLLSPVAVKTVCRKQYTLQHFLVNKTFINFVGWASTELLRLRFVINGFLGYLFYLVLCPWLYGRVFTDGNDRGYMTYKGWVISQSDYIAFPDIMVIVIPHLVFVVFPSVVLVTGFAMELEIYRVNSLAVSGKKDDDQCHGTSRYYCTAGRRCIRKFLMLLCFGILYRHFKSCRALMKAYEMNPILHFPVYSFFVPMLLAYTIYRTRRVYPVNFSPQGRLPIF